MTTKDPAQLDRFKKAARKLGGDEDEKAYDEKLKGIARQKLSAVPQYRNSRNLQMNDSDGRYALDCWTDDEPGKRDPGKCLFSDHDGELDVLTAEAGRRIRDGDARFIELCEKNEHQPDGWRRLIRVTVPEQFGAE